MHDEQKRHHRDRGIQLVHLVALSPEQRLQIVNKLVDFFIPYVPPAWRQIVWNYICEHVDLNDPTFDVTVFQVRNAIEKIIEDKS